MASNGPNLNQAYSLETPDDNIALYQDWASTYDIEFAKSMDYQLPHHVANIFMQHSDALNGAILDVGAGTGLLAECLVNKQTLTIDALDISQAMLDVAAKKGLYRHTIVADLTVSLSLANESYDAIISSGTFTHGHVGPDAFDELLRVAKNDALFVLSVNAEHFVSRGFEAKFKQLETSIKEFSLHTVPIYGACADAAHQGDKGHIVSFQKA